MRKAICKKCYERHYRNWDISQDISWRNGHVLCPLMTSDGPWREFVFKRGDGKPPQWCYYTLEQIIGSEKHGLKYLKEMEYEAQRGFETKSKPSND